MKITVATCYFPVDSNIRRNAKNVSRQMHAVKERGAHVAHFPEACLSGYVGADFKSYRGFDWDLLGKCAQELVELARLLRVWVILGSAHRLSGWHKPHNSVYIINDRGEIVDRYDKRFCERHHTPGDHFSVFEIVGIRCGSLICHEYRYPELYREYKRRGVQLMFHSYHAGHMLPGRLKFMRDQVGAKFHPVNRGTTLPEITMPATMQAAAASSHVWISCSNTSARESCWPSFFVRPDGVITGRLRRNIAGVLLSTVDTNERLYDSTRHWRDRAMRGIFHGGALVRDRRSAERTQL